MLAIVGESGAGKSTLLHILSALDRASAGNVYCAQLRLNALSADEAAEFRNRESGFRLAVSLSAAGVHGGGKRCDAAAGSGATWQKRRRKLHAGCVRSDWSSAGITARESFRAESNSGLLWRGRSLPARNCCWRMSLPGILDGQTAEAIFELIARLHREHQLTSLIATHNLSFARRCHRVLRLETRGRRGRKSSRSRCRG